MGAACPGHSLPLGRDSQAGVEIRIGTKSAGAYGAVAFRDLEEWRLDAYLKVLQDNVLSLGAGLAGTSSTGGSSAMSPTLGMWAAAAEHADGHHDAQLLEPVLRLRGLHGSPPGPMAVQEADDTVNEALTPELAGPPRQSGQALCSWEPFESPTLSYHYHSSVTHL